MFVFMLYHLYKFCMKLQNLPKDEPKTNLVGRTATIYVHLGEGRHLASVNISGALREVEVVSLNKKIYPVNEPVTIRKYEDNKLYID